MAHTPGPWVAIKGVSPSDDMRCGVAAVRGKLQYMVATIENGAPGDICDTEWANALLMAGADSMLTALTAIESLCNEEIDARALTEGDELHSLLVVPRNIARAAIRALAQSHREPKPSIPPVQFPPTTCVAWEDCNHDGVCHDAEHCGYREPKP